MHSFPFAPFDSLGQPSRAIEFITGDDRNNIWFNGGKLIRYNLEAEKFDTISLVYSEEEVKLNRISYDSVGFLWLGSRAELVRFNPYSRTFEWAELFRYEQMSPTIRRGLTVDHVGQIWFGIDRG
jgi:ligand-binding sensor domain-containing protein